MTTRPDHTEAAEYYFTYIDQVPAGDIRDILAKQSVEALALLQTVAEQDSLHRYAPDKWSMREAIGHVNDAERLFVSRAFWFARGFDSPLPSFDQNVARTREPGAVTSRNSRRSARPRSRCSAICHPRRGTGAERRAATPSPFARSRTSPRGIPRIT
jgi:hypothetical protein